MSKINEIRVGTFALLSLAVLMASVGMLLVELYNTPAANWLAITGTIAVILFGWYVIRQYNRLTGDITRFEGWITKKVSTPRLYAASIVLSAWILGAYIVLYLATDSWALGIISGVFITIFTAQIAYREHQLVKLASVRQLGVTVIASCIANLVVGIPAIFYPVRILGLAFLIVAVLSLVPMTEYLNRTRLMKTVFAGLAERLNLDPVILKHIGYIILQSGGVRIAMALGNRAGNTLVHTFFGVIAILLLLMAAANLISLGVYLYRLRAGHRQ